MDQDYGGFIRCIVVNDGSTDATRDVIEQAVFDYSRADPNRQIVAIHKQNGGTGSALNAGIKYGRGSGIKYVCWLSHDDAFYLTKIGNQVRWFEMRTSPDTFGLCSNWDIIDEHGHITQRITIHSKYHAFLDILCHNQINGSSIMLRRDVFRRVGLFDEKLEADVDGDFWLRMLSRNLAIRHVANGLLRYRVHSTQKSANSAKMRRAKDIVRERAIRSLREDFTQAEGQARVTVWKGIADSLMAQGLNNAAKAALERATICALEV